MGANNGWFTVRMLALGANVTAVEPQADFARALALLLFVHTGRTAAGALVQRWGAWLACALQRANARVVLAALGTEVGACAVPCAMP